MNTEKTGGAAFPITKDAGYQTTVVVENGMTLLDYFAAKTMESALSLFGKIPEHESGRELIAKQSYKMAAAMIEERKKYINQ
jgi:hypothetical protein